jgi:hypothetical protein
MKKITFTSLLFLMILGTNIYAQNGASEKFGNTLNAGIGIGYYGYIGYSTPVLHADYEFDVAKNFTLAPFITYYSYKSHYYWGDPNYTYKNYYYRQTVIPIGVKGTYYFDQLLNAGPKWDFYAAGSLGFAIRTTTWDDGYYGTKTVNRGPGALYLDAHIGAEYHLNNQIGLFLDLSSGISTTGLALHF